MRLNPPPGEAEASRLRQAVEHQKLIKRAEAAVWRREQALEQCTKPRTRAKAAAKLAAARRSLADVRIRGSRTSGPDVIEHQRAVRRKAARIL